MAVYKIWLLIRLTNLLAGWFDLLFEPCIIDASAFYRAALI